MGRPPKEPGKPRKRIQPFVAEDTAWYLKHEVTASGIPMGDIIDIWFRDRAKMGSNILGSLKPKKEKKPLHEKVIDKEQRDPDLW